MLSLKTPLQRSRRSTRCSPIADSKRGIGLAVSHVGTELSVLDHHRSTRSGVDTKIGQWRLRRSLAEPPRLSKECERVFEGDDEQLLFRVKTAGLRLLGIAFIALGQVRTELAVLGPNGFAGFGIVTQHLRERK